MKKLLTVFAVALVLTLAIASVALAKGVPEKMIINWGELDSITSIGGHTIKLPAVKVVEPTCTEGGWAQFDCTEPNCDHFHYVYFKALGHDWSSAYAGTKGFDGEWGNIVEKPTCTKTGLAIDVCYRCKIVNWEKTRVIDMLPHVYSPIVKETDIYQANAHYHFAYQPTAKFQVVKAGTCVTEGSAYRCCLECGFVETSTLVYLYVSPHTWTDWKVTKKPACKVEGAAERACIVCGVHQKLTKKVDAASYALLIQPLNPGWDDTIEAVLKGKCEWERVRESDWLTTCYTHNDVYRCPYCKGTVHKIVADMDMPLTSHVWKSAPEKVQDTGIDTTGKLWSSAIDTKRLEYAWKNACSVAPTCLYDGFDLYMCMYDNLNGYDDSWWPRQHDWADSHRFEVKRIPALDHDWDDWKLMQTYTLDGEDVYLWIRGCKRCTATEELINFGEEPTEEVLISVLKLNKESKSLKVGKSYTLKATVNIDATNKNLQWTSSNPKVATVSKNGKVKALKKGTAYITCKALDGSGKTATCKIKVTK